MMSEEKLEKIHKTIDDLWVATWGVTGSEVVMIADQIDNIFHRSGYVIAHSRINRFVLECLVEEVERGNEKGK